MEKVIAIKNELIKAKREINYIIKHREGEFALNIFTGYRSEATIELEQAWDRYYTLSKELKAACLNDDLIYRSIVQSADEEAAREEVKQDTRLFLTVEDLMPTKKEVKPATQKEHKEVTVVTQANDLYMTTDNNKEEVVQEAHEEATTVLKEDDSCMINESSKEDEEFWKLVNESATDKKMDLVSEVWGDLSSLYNNKAAAPATEEAEEWKDLKNTDYQVSSFGRVRDRKTNKIIEAFKSNNMIVVKLGDVYLPLAQLVFSVFNDTICKNIEHIDKDITNNHLSNLRAA